MLFLLAVEEAQKYTETLRVLADLSEIRGLAFFLFAPALHFGVRHIARRLGPKSKH